jgi:dimethylamine/trimethylamine dehydrogenase
MPPHPSHEVLFEPVQIGPKTLKNRFYQVPHCTSFGTDRPGMQARFRQMKAEGGWAAVCTESCSISPETDASPYILGRLWDDDDVRNLAQMCEAVHAHDALAGVQLYYGAPPHVALESRMSCGGPSQISEPFAPWVVPRMMLREDILRIQAAYESAARRSLSAGFDIVYVQGMARSWGPMHFLNRRLNQRSDEYGGSFENRARHWRDTVEGVRNAVDGNAAVAVRITVDGVEGELESGELLGFIEFADDLVDLWDVAVGNSSSEIDVGTSRFFGENHEREWTTAVRAHTRKPIVCVGRFTNPDTMVDVIRSGQSDLIGAARPSIADPFLPKKIEEGRLEDIRECIGCNFCVARYDDRVTIGCTQNPTSGEEHRRGWHPERVTPAANRDRDVLVIGAGVAGLECARVLGERGMRSVHLVDASAEVGGYVGWISGLPRLSEWRRVVSWRMAQLDRLSNVAVIKSKHLDLPAVLDYGGQLVVVATGARWSTSGINAFRAGPIPGADASEPYIVTPEQLVLDRKPVGEHVVVYDCEGYFMAATLAEYLARAGHEVTYLTPMSRVAEYTLKTAEHFATASALTEVGVTLKTDLTVLSAAPGGIRAISVTGDASEMPADSVVLVTQRVSEDELYRDLMSSEEALLENGVHGVFRIGDCVAPRHVADCVFDGHRLAREIDSADPSQPLPFIRERAVVTG